MSRRALTLALAISVALNLFLLGVGAARLWQHGERGPRGLDRSSRAAGRAAEWLDEGRRSELRERRKTLREARRHVQRALASPAFDAEQLRGALKKLRGESQGLQEALHESLLERAAQLGVAERRRLFERELGKRRRPGHRRESR